MSISLLFFFEDARLIWLQTCLAGIQHSKKPCSFLSQNRFFLTNFSNINTFSRSNFSTLINFVRENFSDPTFSFCYSTIKLSPQFPAVEYSVTLIKLNSPSSTPFGFSMPENVSVLLALSSLSLNAELDSS